MIPRSPSASMAVVIVSFNTHELLEGCVRSVQADGASQVVVVDNASTDGSAEVVAENFPSVVLVRNQRNVGFAVAANEGVRACTTPFVLLLNADTRLRPGTLRVLSSYLDEHPKAAVVGPLLVGPDDRVQPSARSFPVLWDLLLDWTHLYNLIRLTPLRNYFPRTFPHDRARIVPWITGAALAIRTKAFAAVDGIDEAFFMYYEEVDLCYRLAKAGWEVHMTPFCKVEHVGGASARQRRADMIVQLYASLALFYQRHYSSSQRCLLRALLGVVATARLVRDWMRWHLIEDQVSRAEVASNIEAWSRLLRRDWRTVRRA